MDLSIQKAIADYMSQRKPGLGINPMDYGKMQISNPLTSSVNQSDQMQPTLGTDSLQGSLLSSGTPAAAALITSIVNSAVAAQQAKAQEELFKKKSDENNKEFYDNLEMKRKKEAQSAGQEANRSTFGASDTGIRTASNSHDIGSSGVNNIVNALAKTYLTKG